MMTFADIVKRIESLPPLSDVVLKIQGLYRDGSENVNMTKLIRLIESDAALTANVLKFVNDPKYGFEKKISSVSQAVTLLGSEIIYGIVVEYAIHEKLHSNPAAYGVTNIQFNDICHLQSSLILQWYTKIDIRDAQFLMSLALIMELGKLVMAKEITESDYALKFRRGLAKVKSISEYEYAMFDTTSYYVSGLLFQHWKLNPLFVDIMKHLDFESDQIEKKVQLYRDVLDVVRTAVNVKEILTPTSIKEASLLVEEMGLSGETFRHIALRMKKSYEDSKGIA